MALFTQVIVLRMIMLAEWLIHSATPREFRRAILLGILVTAMGAAWANIPAALPDVQVVVNASSTTM